MKVTKQCKCENVDKTVQFSECFNDYILFCDPCHRRFP